MGISASLLWFWSATALSQKSCSCTALMPPTCWQTARHLKCLNYILLHANAGMPRGLRRKDSQVVSRTSQINCANALLSLSRVHPIDLRLRACTSSKFLRSSSPFYKCIQSWKRLFYLRCGCEAQSRWKVCASHLGNQRHHSCLNHTSKWRCWIIFCASACDNAVLWEWFCSPECLVSLKLPLAHRSKRVHDPY